MGKTHLCPNQPEALPPAPACPHQSQPSNSRARVPAFVHHALLTLQEVLPQLLQLPHAAVTVHCLYCPSLPGDTAAWAPTWVQPSPGWRRPIHTHITSGCEHSPSPLPISRLQFSHRLPYPTHGHPREKQLLYPDVRTLTRERRLLLTDLALAGSLNGAVGPRLGGDRGRRVDTG
jgi:hypothetical protein